MSTRQSPPRGVLPSLYVAMAFLAVYVGLCAYWHTPALAEGAQKPGTTEARGAPAGPLRKFTGALPPAVVDMREALLAAADMGDISELTHAIELNELKPDFGDEAKGDPIAYWKKTSKDGEGREVLAKLATLLALPPAKVSLGQNPENTDAFVWPYLAESALESLKPGEIVDAYRLVTPEELRAMVVTKRWTDWRLVISADGTWLSFKR